MSGGGGNKQYNLDLRKAFSDTPDSRFEQYVDTKGDLSNAWNLINTYQQGGDMSGFSYHNEMSPADQAKYWIKKAEGGRFNKADFGRFHAAEDKSLLEGNYPGGTEVRPGTDAYDSYFPEGKTRYEGGLLSGEGGSGGESGNGNGLLTNPGTGIGPYPLDNMYFPQLTHEYEAPQAQDWSQYLPSWINGPLSQMGGLLYQPGTQEYMEQFPMPENILNYQPPQINRQPVQYFGAPFGPLNITAPEDLFQEEEEEEEEEEGGGGNDDNDEIATHTTIPDSTVFGPSDIRLKENISHLGKSGKYNIYSWDWNDKAKQLGIDDPTTGVIAQEVLSINPDAVTIDDSGYYLVNYGEL